MTKNYKHIILFLWCCLLWASPSMASFEDSRISNIEFFSISKDTITPIENDSTKTKKPDLLTERSRSHLARLQQMASVRSGVGILNTNAATPLKTAQGANSNVTEKAEKTFRSFPSLDEKILENNNFNISFADRKPEFTPEFIAVNFDNNPKVDTLLAKAKKAFEAIQELGNFVDIITGNELLQLPVGLSKRDSTSGNSVQLAITQVKFTPQYAEFKAWAKLTIPQKGTPASASVTPVSTGVIRI